MPRFTDTHIAGTRRHPQQSYIKCWHIETCNWQPTFAGRTLPQLLAIRALLQRIVTYHLLPNVPVIDAFWTTPFLLPGTVLSTLLVRPLRGGSCGLGPHAMATMHGSTSKECGPSQA